MPTDTTPKTQKGRKKRQAAASHPATEPQPRESFSEAVRSVGPGPVPVRVRRQQAAKRIRDAAAVATAWEWREHLDHLADRVQGGAGDPQRAEFIEAAIVRCLDHAAAIEGTDRWLACEGATWALGWMARSRRAGGSAGSLLEKLVQQATAARLFIADGDTLPSLFMYVLARLFADIEACRRFESVAIDAVAGEIDRLVSVRGVVRTAGSAAIVERVVRWCRIREISKTTGGSPWGHATERRWREAATGAIRLLGQNGRLLTETGLLPIAFTRPLLQAVDGLGRRRTRTVGAVRQSARGITKPSRFIRRDLHDATAAGAVMRSGWDNGSVRVFLDYSSPVPLLEVAVADRLLVAGPWAWQVSVDGRPVEAEGPWTMSCWESSRDASFLEITRALPGGRQFERQIVLLPKDRVLVLADAVTTPDAAASSESVPTTNGVLATPHLRYQGMLRLTAGLEGRPAKETREARVVDTTERGTAMPLSLSEWRTAGRGSLTSASENLTLTHETPGTRFYAPIWLDLDPGRVEKAMTWRQLTVADTRIILPQHQAAGFRVQVGSDQWLLYRSLDAPRNRTLLGCNVSCDFLIGRIKRDGTVRRLLEIE